MKIFKNQKETKTFNWDSYMSGNIIVQCNDKVEYRNLMCLCHQHGIMWNGYQRCFPAMDNHFTEYSFKETYFNNKGNYYMIQSEDDKIMIRCISIAEIEKNRAGKDYQIINYKDCLFEKNKDFEDHMELNFEYGDKWHCYRKIVNEDGEEAICKLDMYKHHNNTNYEWDYCPMSEAEILEIPGLYVCKLSDKDKLSDKQIETIFRQKAITNYLDEKSQYKDIEPEI